MKKEEPQREATKAEEIIFKRLIKRIVNAVKSNEYPRITKYLTEKGVMNGNRKENNKK